MCGRHDRLADLQRLEKLGEIENLVLCDELLERMERQLIPLLNTIRVIRGKRPVIVPGERRAHD